ncbi:MAG: hypothetical protein ACRCW2_08540 [Cellulosilyticaceae bacterium]
MKWESGVPFYKQISFWVGTTVFFFLLALLSRNKNQVIICGNANGSANDTKQDACPDGQCD